MDLNQALSKHSEWKTKFRSAIGKQESLDDATISRDNCCEMGKWLHGDAKTQYGRLQSLADCVSRHAEFHIEAGRVARSINARKYAEAEAMLAVGTRYANASSALGTSVIRLKKEAGI